MSNVNNNWNDFNNAEEQNDFDVIPKGTLVKVRMSIRPGGYDNHEQGWNGGYAKMSETSGAIYLDCEFVVLEGQYARRRIWSLIGLHSDKGPKWAEMGRAFIKNILNSAHGLKRKDNSPQALQARCIAGLHELDGIEFVAKVGIDKDQYDEPKNIIQIAVTPDHTDYASVMRMEPVVRPTQASDMTQAAPSTAPQTTQLQNAPQSGAPTQTTPSNSSTSTGQSSTGRPAWAN